MNNGTEILRKYTVKMYDSKLEQNIFTLFIKFNLYLYFSCIPKTIERGI